LGETRVVTKQTSKLEKSYGQSDEWHHQYYYHPDHLGSAQLVTDYEGNEYQRIEYTPYGELWVEKKTEKEEGLRHLPYKFTAKEMDEETGLYYYGARYLDAKYSRWLSADPAVKDYIPQAGGDNAKLPNGGMYNYTNLSLYHYSNNNPIKYTDPDGRSGKLTIYSQRGTNNLLPQKIDENGDQKQSSWIYGNHSWISFTDDETGETTYYGTWGHDNGGNFGLRVNDSSEKYESEANQTGIDLDIETRTKQLDDKQQGKLEKYISNPFYNIAFFY